MLIACDNVKEESFIKEEPKKEESLFFLQNDQIILNQNQQQIIFFLKNDSIPKKVDIDFSSPSHGTLNTETEFSISSITDYTITYTPNKNFVGKDSIVYTLCDDKGICKTATIYITIQGNTIIKCDFTIPFVLNEIKISSNEIDSFFLDLSHISCPLRLSMEGDIKGWISSKQVNHNQFLINYKAPEKGGFYEKIQLKICDTLNTYCQQSILLYDVQHIICSNWLAKDDFFTIKTDSKTTKEFIISKQKLYSNDDYCLDKKMIFSITKFPIYGKLIISNNELIYYSSSDLTQYQEDIFTYKICNEQGQCSQADVKLISN